MRDAKAGKMLSVKCRIPVARWVFFNQALPIIYVTCQESWWLQDEILCLPFLSALIRIDDLGRVDLLYKLSKLGISLP